MALRDALVCIVEGFKRGESQVFGRGELVQAGDYAGDLVDGGVLVASVRERFPEGDRVAIDDDGLVR